jgi:8-oxo-dGTP pyrophosphatase MutT (NUDIX family)
MSFLQRIREVNGHVSDGVIPFRVAGVRVGLIRHGFAQTLTRWPDVFRVDDEGVGLEPGLDSYRTSREKRSRAVNEVLAQLRDEGLIRGWRNELFPVMGAFGDSPLLLMERAAIPLFGVRAYGVHLNGFVRGEHGVAMWIGRRSRNKPTSPGKLDQLVAGGQPAGMGLRENLIKECWEEAGISLAMAQRVVSVGAISYCLEVPQGLRSDVIFNFDLELPADFAPMNRDGEMEDFYLWPMEKVIETVRDTREFKPNCALVVIDFLVRHGFIPPDHPDYLQIIAGLMNRDVLLADLSA